METVHSPVHTPVQRQSSPETVQPRDSPVQNPCPWLHQPNIVTLSIVIIQVHIYVKSKWSNAPTSTSKEVISGDQLPY